jgi:hypothetical protein
MTGTEAAPTSMGNYLMMGTKLPPSLQAIIISQALTGPHRIRPEMLTNQPTVCARLLDYANLLPSAPILLLYNPDAPVDTLKAGFRTWPPCGHTK